MPVNKVRSRGSYAPLSAHYYKDDAIADAGEAAELLFLRGLAFCADVISDGFISDTQLSRFVGVGMRDATKRAKRLVEVGLWAREDAGWRVTSWLGWNRSRAEILDLNRKDADRKGSRPAGDDDEIPPPADDGLPPDSDRNPNGNRPDSRTDPDRNPNGLRPRVGARVGPYARPPTPTPTPLHSSAVAEAPAARLAVGDVVDAWTEAVTANGTTTVPAGMRNQVAREARQLLDSGTDPELVLRAARDVGGKGFPTLQREVVALQGKTRAGLRAVSTTTGELSHEQITEILGPETPPNPPDDVYAQGHDAVKAWGRENDPLWWETRRQAALARIGRTAP